jgi:hypothetical protein
MKLHPYSRSTIESSFIELCPHTHTHTASSPPYPSKVVAFLLSIQGPQLQSLKMVGWVSWLPRQNAGMTKHAYIHFHVDMKVQPANDAS